MDSLYNTIGKVLVWGFTGCVVIFALMLLFLFIREQWRNLCGRTGINEFIHYYRGKSFDTQLLRDAYKYAHWGRMHMRWVIRFRLRNIQNTRRKPRYTRRCTFCQQQFDYGHKDIVKDGVHHSAQCPHCRMLNIVPNPLFIDNGFII